jgi:hypothetical protein
LSCIKQRSAFRGQRPGQANECVLVLRFKLEKRVRHVAEHPPGLGGDKRIGRRTAMVPVEQICDRDVEDPSNGEKSVSRDPVATMLVLMYLLIAETELLGHLLLEHAGQQAQSFDLVAEEAVSIRTRGPAHVRHFPLRPRALSAAPMQVGARAGIGAFHALARARPRELFAGVPGKFGHVGEAYKRSLLAAPELGNFALDKESRKLQVGPSGGRVAIHGLKP